MNNELSCSNNHSQQRMPHWTYFSTASANRLIRVLLQLAGVCTTHQKHCCWLIFASADKKLLFVIFELTLSDNYVSVNVHLFFSYITYRSLIVRMITKIIFVRPWWCKTLIRSDLKRCSSDWNRSMKLWMKWNEHLINNTHHHTTNIKKSTLTLTLKHKHMKFVILKCKISL